MSDEHIIGGDGAYQREFNAQRDAATDGRRAHVKQKQARRGGVAVQVPSRSAGVDVRLLLTETAGVARDLGRDTSSAGALRSLPVIEELRNDLVSAPAHGIRTFEVHAPSASEVFLAGSFNEWDPKATPMRMHGSGTWSVTLPLFPGRHEYKYLVDGEWRCADGCEEKDHACPNCVSNDFGTRNSVFEI